MGRAEPDEERPQNVRPRRRFCRGSDRPLVRVGRPRENARERTQRHIRSCDSTKRKRNAPIRTRPKRKATSYQCMPSLARLLDTRRYENCSVCASHIAPCIKCSSTIFIVFCNSPQPQQTRVCSNRSLNHWPAGIYSRGCPPVCYPTSVVSP